jgi:hypothetical protein
MQKVRGHTFRPTTCDERTQSIGIVLPLLVGTRFQILFHSPSRGSFHLSLTVLGTHSPNPLLGENRCATGGQSANFVRQRDLDAVEGGMNRLPQVVVRVDIGELGRVDQAVQKCRHLGTALGARAMMILST